MWLLGMLCLLSLLAAHGMDASERRHRVQHGPCSYTFILPQVEQCATQFQVSNSLQRDSPSPPGATPTQQTWQEKKLEVLESAMENNTQWLQKLENYIQENVRSEMEELQRHAAHTQTAAMLEIGSNLLSQSAEQTRKLTDVETQVMNQTTRLEVQLLEYSLSTHKLEKQIVQQTQEITRLNDKNSFLEQRLAAVENRHVQELQLLRVEKLQLQELLGNQSHLVAHLETELSSSARNSTQLREQQATLTQTVQKLLALVAHCNEISLKDHDGPRSFQDCAEIYKSGVRESGVYGLRLPNSTRTFKVFCDMKSQSGGWTVIQRRIDGSVDFQRDWADYKAGFGDPAGEHWAGNELIHLITTAREYALQVHLRDADGSEAYALYDRFHTEGESKNYSLHTRGFGGSAGRTNSLAHSGTPFSTRDRDNDRCSCKCAQMATGGWWFEACGPSNLNGVYYTGRSNVLRYNGIKWYYWKGPGLRVVMATMMVRPSDF